MQIKHKILRFLKPIQIWIQQLGYQENDFTTELIERLLIEIKPGDILGSYESGRFTSWLIKGEFDHVAMVDKDLYVIEAVGDRIVNGKNLGGVRKVKLEEWLWKKNHIFIARHKDSLVSYYAASQCCLFVGRNYDYSFESSNEDLYCAEIPYISIKPFDTYFMDYISKDKEILPIMYLRDKTLKIIYNSKIKLEF